MELNKWTRTIPLLRHLPTSAQMSTVKSALFQSIYHLLNAEDLKSTAKALAKETTIDKKAPASDDLLAIYNQYLEQKKQQVSKEESSSESDSSSSSDSESEDEKPIAKPPAAVRKKDESSDSDSSDSESEDEKPQPKKVVATPAKKDESSDDSDSDSEEEVKKPVVPAKKAQAESSSDSSDSSDSEEEAPKVAGNKVRSLLSSPFSFLFSPFREKPIFLTNLHHPLTRTLRVKMKNQSLKLPQRLSHLPRDKKQIALQEMIPVPTLLMFVDFLGLPLKKM
jgi:hypothetical protein